MSWFKRQQPLSLAQTSDLPYVILENGVRLCHSNFYEESNSRNTDEHIIHFSASRPELVRQSTYLFKFRIFPTTLPFQSISRLDNVILDGKILRYASYSNIEDKKISIIKMERLPELFDDYSSHLETYAHNFILSNGEDTTPEARLLESDGQAHVLYHKGWERTCVAIAHETCGSTTRKYCWTRFVPEMEVVCFGLESADDKESIHSCFDNIGVSASIVWVD